MIRNLNAITFRDFGAVLSERPQNAKNIEKEAGTLLKLDGEVAVVYRATEQTQISGGTAMIVCPSVPMARHSGISAWISPSA